jgi:hypothetical protein
MQRSRWRLPEVLIGALLTVAVFTAGALTFAHHKQGVSYSVSERDSQRDGKAQKDETIYSLLKPTDAVGFYTLTLSVFTLALVIASIAQGWFLLRANKTALIAAKAADLSARAAIGIELPIIGASSPELNSIDAPITPDESYGSRETIGIPTKYSVIPKVTLRNDGRTPAFLTEVIFGWAVSIDEPSDFFDSQIYQIDPSEIIPPNDSFEAWQHYQFELADDQIKALDNRAQFLWLTVRASYLDFLSELHTVNFKWRWNNPGGGMYLFERGGSPFTQYGIGG